MMQTNRLTRAKLYWGAFDDNWTLVAEGQTRIECERALDEYLRHVVSSHTYRFSEFYKG